MLRLGCIVLDRFQFNRRTIPRRREMQGSKKLDFLIIFLKKRAEINDITMTQLPRRPYGVRKRLV